MVVAHAALLCCRFLCHYGLLDKVMQRSQQSTCASCHPNRNLSQNLPVKLHSENLETDPLATVLILQEVKLSAA